MKKVFSNNRLIALAFFTVFSMGAAPLVQANETNPILPVELKFVGKVMQHAVFQLNFFGNLDENEIRISILDEYGNYIFSENIKGEVFSQRFLFNPEEIAESPVRFEIISRKSRKKVVFEVSRNMHFVDEMTITTLK